MSKIFENTEELVGHTPLVHLGRIEKKYNLTATLLAKLEMFNPAGSAKDRVAKYMLKDLEERGALSKDTVIIEPTSGNTGIGIASLCATRGIRCIIVMPDTMSEERRLLISAYGAELVLTDGALGMSGAIKKAEELRDKIPNAIIAGQFTNPANPTAHRDTTGPEIWEDTDGCVDIFVAGVGTGGTLTGVSEHLKNQKPGVKAVAVEPADSPLISKGYSGAHKIQGIGANFIPEILNTKIVDETVTVSTDEAFSAGRELGRSEGLLVGISSGAALHAAIQIAKREENEGKTVVVLLPDTGERYLSSEMFK